MAEQRRRPPRRRRRQTPDERRFGSRRSVMAAPLIDPSSMSPRVRDLLGVSENAEAIPVVVELNLLHAQGLPGAMRRFVRLYNERIAQASGPAAISERDVIGTMYVPCDLTQAQM